MLPHPTPRRESEENGDQILTKAVKAGRRTYFFDVRATRGDDYFLTITESRKMPNPDGTCSYDRHKIFLYKEDFAKFAGGTSGSDRLHPSQQARVLRAGGREGLTARMRPLNYTITREAPL